MNDRSCEAFRHAARDGDFVHGASEVVETAHARVDDIVRVVLCSRQNQTLGARFGKVKMQRLQFGLAATFENRSDGREHAEVVVVCDRQFQVADSLEDAEAEEVVHLEECAVDHWVQVLDHERLGVDDL